MKTYPPAMSKINQNDQTRIVEKCCRDHRLSAILKNVVAKFLVFTSLADSKGQKMLFEVSHTQGMTRT